MPSATSNDHVGSSTISTPWPTRAPRRIQLSIWKIICRSRNRRGGAKVESLANAIVRQRDEVRNYRHDIETLRLELVLLEDSNQSLTSENNDKDFTIERLQNAMAHLSREKECMAEDMDALRSAALGQEKSLLRYRTRMDRLMDHVESVLKREDSLKHEVFALKKKNESVEDSNNFHKTLASRLGMLLEEKDDQLRQKRDQIKQQQERLTMMVKSYVRTR